MFSLNTPTNNAPSKENYINLMLTTGYRTQMNITKNGFLPVTGNENEVVEKEWSYVAFCTVWDKDARISTYSVSVNLNAAVTASNGQMITDDPSNSKLIGAENNVETPGAFVKRNFYAGIIWEFCLYSTYIVDHDPYIGGDDCDDNECTNCPPGICLIDCEWDEFLDTSTGECLPCQEECE